MLRLSRFSSSSASTPFDICIIGGGIVGSCLASDLGIDSWLSDGIGLFSQGRLRIALIDSNNLHAELSPNQYSNRVSSITPSSAKYLDSLHAWKNIPPERICSYTKMHVWEGVGYGRLSFDAAEHGLPSIASIVENNVLQSAIVKTLGDSVTIFNKTKVESIETNEHQDEWPKIKLESGQELSCRLLVGADGGNSIVRQVFNIPTYGWEYRQKGIVATVQVDETLPNDAAWQRFLPTGPLALLPLSQGWSSIVWSIDIPMADKVLKLSKKDFKTLLNAALVNPYEDIQFLLSQINEDGSVQVDFDAEANWGLSRQQSTTPFDQQPLKVMDIVDQSVAGFPLRCKNSEQYYGHRMALIGDAAHTVHPLAGQGLNLGLKDAKALGDVIRKAIEEGQDVGRKNILEQYGEQQKRSDALMMGMIEGAWQVFRGEHPVIGRMRELGMGFINGSQWLKSIIVKMAS